MRERNGQRFKGLCVRVSAGLFAERKVKQSALECTNIVLAGWLTAMSGAPLPSSSRKTSERVVSGRRHAGRTPRRPSHSRLLLAICGSRELSRERREKKKIFCLLRWIQRICAVNAHAISCKISFAKNSHLERERERSGANEILTGILCLCIVHATCACFASFGTFSWIRQPRFV